MKTLKGKSIHVLNINVKIYESTSLYSGEMVRSAFNIKLSVIYYVDN